MSKASQEEWGRVCQATAYESARALNELAANFSHELRENLTSGLLLPADEQAVEANGRQWSRHQCRRCGMAVLRLCTDKSQIMMDTSQGVCETALGRQIMKQYPALPG